MSKSKFVLILALLDYRTRRAWASATRNEKGATRVNGQGLDELQRLIPASAASAGLQSFAIAG